MLEESDISVAIQRNGALAVYQLAILDFLNSAKKAADIAGVEPSVGPIVDDPTRGGRGYDIGLKVAQRLLRHRKKLGGFTNMAQLAKISYFGKDKLHDLIYTFMNFRSPVPTGLGKQFDDFIMALSELEIAALKSGLSYRQILSVVRKLFLDNQIGPKNNDQVIKLKWDKVIPKSKDLEPPQVWAIKRDLIKAMEFLTDHPVIQIGSESINVKIIIAALDARNHPDKVLTGHDKLKIESNLNAIGYMIPLAETTYKYLSPFSIRASQKFDIEQDKLDTIYNTKISFAEYASIADAYNMKFDGDRSLTWNFLKYYTDSDKPTKNRYRTLAKAMNLGSYKDGLLSKDNQQTRTVLLEGVQASNFFMLKENGRSQVVNRMLSGNEADGSYMAYRVSSAYVLDVFIDRLTILVGMEINMPTIISWNRLEARPRKEDFSRTLKAEVRDALWFISRQWQFGEFRGEDAGSALEMRVDMQTSKVDRFSLKGAPAKEFDLLDPMETTVEREPVLMDLTIRQEMGRHFEHLLQTHLSTAPNVVVQSSINKVIADFRAENTFQFSLPQPPEDFPEIHSNPALVKNYVAIAHGRMLDGGAVYAAVKGGAEASTFVSSSTSANVLAKVDAVALELLDWFERVYSQPETAADSAWNAKQLEYQFQCSAAKGNSTRSVLNTDEYANGHLDWYSFDFETSSSQYPPSLTSGPVNQDKLDRKLITVLPTDLNYPGMPVPRWWQFEDFKVDLGDIKANTNELPKLLMSEFALIYSNDWMLMPFDVAVGSLCEIKSVVVRDVFGQYTTVKAAGARSNSDWQRWSMFNLNRRNLSSGSADTRLFVPPAVVRTMESDPIESVSLLRDEMSNMVWGIEKTIPDGLGGAMEGGEAARRLHELLVSKTIPTDPEITTVANDAVVDYNLGTTVPENWIPFIPVRLGGVTSRQIQLRRAAMPRIIKGRPPERIRPRTELLKTGYDPVADTWGPYFLHEEEVPRSGVIVNRSWQRSRWMNGKTVTWLGRRVKNGRGEANSGLEFDNVNTKKGASN